MVQDTGRRAEVGRDLRSQLAGLSAPDAEEVVFIDVSPRRQRVTLYRTDTGEPIPIPVYMVEGVMANARLPSGEYAFTSDPSKAPEYKLGTVKCFLHKDSPERPILELIGLGQKFCPAAHLANDYEKDIHGEHRHGKQWKAYQDHLKRVEVAEDKQRQRQQLQATLTMAEAAAGQVPADAPAPVATEDSAVSEPPEVREPGVPPSLTCKCGWVTPPGKRNPGASLGGHKRVGKCSLRVVADESG